MKINKPKFWDARIGLLAILLIPVTLMIYVLIFFKKKFSKTINFNIPIICVGNIYIGGTGKTPLSILISNEIKKSGKTSIIVKKNYLNQEDEQILIKKETGNLILCKDRSSGILEAEKKKFDYVILDDGFQDYSIGKNLSILCFKSDLLVGNGLMIPSGPLRESLNAIKKSEIVLINGSENKKFETKILSINPDIEIFYSKYEATNLNELKDKNLLAVSGIGDPDSFFKLMVESGLAVSKKLIFPDHYQFSRKEISDIVADAKKNDLQVVMTEKDYCRIKKFNLSDIKFLKVNLIIKNKEKLIKKIFEIND